MDTAARVGRRTAGAREAARVGTESRLAFVDNIRVFLTMLVIMHHLLITYAGSGSWYYMETPEDFGTIAVGSWVLSVDQAFFMGLFLFIAAYFVPGSYDRKGAGRFLKDRLVRLGIPLAVYSWVVAPLFAYALGRATGDVDEGFWHFLTGGYFQNNSLIGNGPMWFIETLLIFSTGYAAWRVVRGRLAPGGQGGSDHTGTGRVRAGRFPGSGAIALFALGLGIATFLVRVAFPVGWRFEALNLQFPHFAQYIALFAAGLAAYRQDWLRALPDRTGRLWLGIGVALILLFVPMALALDAANNSELFKGGWDWHALVYALWESSLCVALCVGLVYLFRRHAGRQGAAGRFLARNAYTAFIIHAPVITFMALGVQDWALYPLLKFGVVTVAAIPVCFGIASLVRRAPGAERVL